MTGLQHTDDARGSTRKLTYADFVRFPNDGRRHELIDGVHYVTASPNYWHQTLLQRLSLALGIYLEAQPIGKVLFAPMDCVFSFFDVVEPDLLVILNDQRQIITKRNIKGPPAILAEILSESTSDRDETLKRVLYERVGVQEYWTVNPDEACVVVYRRSHRGFAKPFTLRATAGEELTTPLLPDFALPLPHYFRD